MVAANKRSYIMVVDPNGIDKVIMGKLDILEINSLPHNYFGYFIVRWCLFIKLAEVQHNVPNKITANL